MTETKIDRVQDHVDANVCVVRVRTLLEIDTNRHFGVTVIYLAAVITFTRVPLPNSKIPTRYIACSIESCISS